MSGSGIPLTAISGGMNRLRIKGAARKDSLYQLTNAYVTAGNTIKPRGGTIRNVDLSLTSGAGITKGLVAHQGALHTFSSTFVPVPPGYVNHVLTHPATQQAAPPVASANNASILLHFEEGNGSTAFTDSAGLTPAPVWTAHGAGVQESTVNSKFGTGSLLIPGLGTGLYISTPMTGVANLDFRYSDYTIEGWFYTATWATGKYLWDIDETTQVKCFLGATLLGALQFNITSEFGITSANGVLVKNQWNHVAVTRYGAKVTIWVNGVSVATGSDPPKSPSSFLASSTFNIGGTAVAGQAGFDGYIDDFRMVIGLAIYTATFTPPTVSLTASVTAAGGQIPSLLHFEEGNGSTTFTDSGVNPQIWVQAGIHGAATESTAKAKFGNGSLFISDYDAKITAPQNAGGSLDITSGDFTVELWAYPTAATFADMALGGSQILDMSAGNTTLFRIYMGNSPALPNITVDTWGGNNWSASPPGPSANSSMVQDTWNHIAVMRRNDILTLAVNGIVYSVVSGVLTGNATALPGAGNSMSVGTRIGGIAPARGWTGGYIDEVTITTGLAKYGGPSNTYIVPPAPTGSTALTLPIPLKEIHFAAPFMGFLYAVAEFTGDGGSGLGTVFHYWLQTSGKWLANKIYQVGQIVSPTTANGLSYRATRVSTPNPAWAASTLHAASDVVEPTVPSGYKFTATAVDGSNPITGTVEPTWPTTDGAVVYEESEKTNTGTVAAPAPQINPVTTPSPGVLQRYINPYRGNVF